MRHSKSWDFQKAAGFVQKAPPFFQKGPGFDKKAAGLVQNPPPFKNSSIKEPLFFESFEQSS